MSRETIEKIGGYSFEIATGMAIGAGFMCLLRPETKIGQIAVTLGSGLIGYKLGPSIYDVGKDLTSNVLNTIKNLG